MMSARVRAEYFLRLELEAGEMWKAQLLEHAAREGISVRTLERAAAALDIVHRRHGFHGPISWRLPHTRPSLTLRNPQTITLINPNLVEVEQREQRAGEEPVDRTAEVPGHRVAKDHRRISGTPTNPHHSEPRVVDVIALRGGYYDDRLRHPGDRFSFTFGPLDEGLPSWVVDAKDPPPAPAPSPPTPDLPRREPMYDAVDVRERNTRWEPNW